MTDPIGGVGSMAALPGGATNAGAMPVVELAPSTTADSSIAAAAQPEAAPQASQAEMHALAAALNQHVQDLPTSLHFQVDRITGQMVLSVIDTQSNQVLMQVPSPEALAIAQSLQRLKVQLMNQTA